MQDCLFHSPKAPFQHRMWASDCSDFLSITCWKLNQHIPTFLQWEQWKQTYACNPTIIQGTQTLHLTSPCNDCRRPRSVICENGIVDAWLSSASGISCQFLRMLSGWYAFFSWAHRSHTQSLLIMMWLHRLLRMRHTQKSSLWQQWYILSSLLSVLTLHLFMQTCRPAKHFNALFNGYTHSNSDTIVRANLLLHLSTHTGPLQRGGCISRGQMMALFSLYQPAGCPYPVRRLLMQLASF